MLGQLLCLFLAVARLLPVSFSSLAFAYVHYVDLRFLYALDVRILRYCLNDSGRYDVPGRPHLRHLQRTWRQTPRLCAFRLLLPRILNRFHTRPHSKPVRRLERLSVYTSLNQAVVFSQSRATCFVLRRKAVIVWTMPNQKRLAPKAQLSEDLPDCASPSRAKVRAAISRSRTTPQ
jgi:hypothetical protein